MKKALTSQQGLGIIESVLTLLIITGAAIALLRFQNYLQYSNSVTQQQSDAAQLAINKLETLRDFTAIAGYNSLSSGSTTVTGTSTTYTVAWTVTPVAATNYTTLNVRVSWTDRYNVANAIQQTTDVAGFDPSFEAVIME